MTCRKIRALLKACLTAAAFLFTATAHAEDWRKSLEEKGITLELSEQAEIWTNFAGGVRRGVRFNGLLTGSVELDGREILGLSVRKVLDAGVGFVPEDRNVDGLVAEFSIAENLMLDRSNGAPFVKGAGLQLGFRDRFAEEKVREFDVRAQGIGTHVGRLSGGNQQKVVLARELSRELRLFVAAQPTRGLDVGSIEFVHEQIIAARDAGVPVIVVSTELDEIVALGDRIAVMYRGGIVGIVPATTPRDVLGLMMTGELPPEAQLTEARGVSA